MQLYLDSRRDDYFKLNPIHAIFFRLAEAVIERGPIFAKPPSDAKDPNGAKAPGKPGAEDGFVDPKGGEQWVPNPNPGKGGGKAGWLDANGNVWVPTGQGGNAHGGPHWDVQKPGGGYTNVYPAKN